MTINRTTLLDFPLPVTGTESGVWGDVTNNGLTQYLDIAVAGALSITGSVTLTTTEGDASTTNIGSTTAQYRTLIVPASGPSANVVITAPSSNRTYHVVNLNATYTVQIRAGSASGVTLGVNQSATVTYDSVAADYVLVGTIGPTVPVARGGTGLTSGTSGGVLAFTATGTLASSGALAANALVIGGGAGVAPSTTTTGTGVVTALGVNTGSAGAFVVNGGALGTPSSGTVTNLTGTASININGTVGATTPTTGAFTTATLSSDLTLNGGTANGVLYLNGSKVATSGSALTFDGNRLTVSSATPSIRIDDTNAAGSFGIDWYFSGAGGVTRANISLDGATGEMQFQAGASGSPGWFQTFVLSGSEAMRLTSTGLGIGTSSPGYKLDVRVAPASGGAAGAGVTTGSYEGTIAITGSAYNNYGVGANTAWLYSATNDVAIGPYGGSGTVQIVTGGARRATFDSSGNLGLGVTPSAWNSNFLALQIGARGSVWSSTGSSSTHYSNNVLYDAGGFKYLQTGTVASYEQGGGAHYWYTAPSGTAGNPITFTQAMTLDASGNLGVGTTSPGSYRLAVSGIANFLNNTSQTFRSGLVLEGNGTLAGNLSPALVFSSANVNAAIYSERFGSYGGNLIFATQGGSVGDPTERARITSGGDFGLGVISPAARLDVYSPSTTAGTPIAYMGKALNDSTTSNVLVQFLINSGGTGSGQINSNGASAAAFGTYSDQRLKENIVDLPSQLDSICALRPVEFDYIESEGGGHQIGFIAQEMQEVYPDAVGIRQPDEMLTLTGWDKTTARLVKAIQEQQALITSLTARVALLEGN